MGDSLDPTVAAHCEGKQLLTRVFNLIFIVTRKLRCMEGCGTVVLQDAFSLLHPDLAGRTACACLSDVEGDLSREQ